MILGRLHLIDSLHSENPFMKRSKMLHRDIRRPICETGVGTGSWVIHNSGLVNHNYIPEGVKSRFQKDCFSKKSFFLKVYVKLLRCHVQSLKWGKITDDDWLGGLFSFDWDQQLLFNICFFWCGLYILALFPWLCFSLYKQINVSWLAHSLPEESLCLDYFRVLIFVERQQKLMCIIDFPWN